jgi:hypothetical protein
MIGLRSRQVWTLALLASGAALWALVEWSARARHGHGPGPVRWALVAAAVALASAPAVRRAVNGLLDRIRHPSPRALDRATLGVALGSTCYFVLTAFLQDRDLFPKTHDEGSYVIGMRMLARGRLWMEAHPLADFFDTFYVIVKPVYASLYFPGTALLYAPGDWLNWPTWVMSVVLSGAAVGLLYRIITELVDGAAGALAALMMVSLSWFRMLSVLVFSQVPMLLLALLLIWAWLRWRRDGKLGWALAMGMFAGWAAIVRPLDALCYAIPVGVAVLADLYRGRGRRPSPLPSPGVPGEGEKRAWRQRLLVPVLIVVGAAPFLGLQLYFNKGVTGRWLQTPYTYYLERDQPRTSLGFHAFDPALVPESALAQKRDYYRQFMHHFIQEHQPATVLGVWARKSLPMLFEATLPARVLVVLVPVGLLGLTDIRRRVVWAPLPLFVAGYVLNTFFLEHYAAAVIPAVLLSVVLGLRALEEAWPTRAGFIRAAGTLVVVVVSLTSLYEFNPVATALDRDEATKRKHRIDDETFRSPTLRFAREVEGMVEKPAVVLFRYPPGSPVSTIIEEPVYNTDVAWPDDAPVIRAHDLGERNREIFDYYAQRQPERMFYRFDRATGTVTPIGKARDLARGGK